MRGCKQERRIIRILLTRKVAKVLEDDDGGGGKGRRKNRDLGGEYRPWHDKWAQSNFPVASPHFSRGGHLQRRWQQTEASDLENKGCRLLFPSFRTSTDVNIWTTPPVFKWIPNMSLWVSNRRHKAVYLLLFTPHHKLMRQYSLFSQVFEQEAENMLLTRQTGAAGLDLST